MDDGFLAGKALRPFLLPETECRASEPRQCTPASSPLSPTSLVSAPRRHRSFGLPRPQASLFLRPYLYLGRQQVGSRPVGCPPGAPPAPQGSFAAVQSLSPKGGLTCWSVATPQLLAAPGTRWGPSQRPHTVL